MVRHCDRCKKKVYLCELDERIKFYSSMKFRIALAEQDGPLNVEKFPPSDITAFSDAVERAARPSCGLMSSLNHHVLNVWRRPSSPVLPKEFPHVDAAPSQGMHQTIDASDIPAFLRKRIS